MDKDYKKELIKLVEKTEVNKGYHDYFKNKDLVNNYFEIGKLLIEAQGGEERAKYGNGLIKEWSIELTEKYGRGYSCSNLKNMRLFYLIFKKSQPLAVLLTWTNICLLLPIKNENKRNYYINMCIKKNLSKRELQKEIKNNAFERLSLADKENIKLISNKNEVLTIKDTLAQGGEERAKYGNGLIKEWSIELTEKYGKGYNSSNLKRFRQFYSEFKMCGPLGHILTWTNIRLLLPIKNVNKRNYYINMCIKKNLSKREFEKEIKNNAFERLSLSDKENIKLISDKNEILY